ncbi:MAG TPA: hypothetical protein VKC89_00035 [Patescibacteria group bacterium]|nr:hypothetical protein [Patescibacteria group bacterium]
MIQERLQTSYPEKQEDQWSITPNFQRLMLSSIQNGGWIVTSHFIYLELLSAKKKGKDQSFPPYFDVSDAKGVKEVLSQLEREKLIIHKEDSLLGDDVWALTQAGDKALRANDKPKVLQPFPKAPDVVSNSSKVKTGKVERKSKPPIKQMHVERKRTKAKISPRIEKKRTVEVGPKNIELDKNSLKVKATFDEAVRRLKKRKYGVLIPLFREGADNQGIQVYFSPQGHLCYRPKDKEFVIEIDVAVEVYGKDKILQSLQNALDSRRL